MAFDETKVARETDGKFAEKSGWPPEVDLGGSGGAQLPASSANWKKYEGPDLREDRNLSNLMDFDHVIAIGPDGEAYEGVSKHAPDCFNVDPYSNSIEGWELMTGYTGQHGYDGPWMHDSEQLDGRMVGDILDRPGYYVAVYASYPDEDEPESGQTYEEGWAVAYKPFES